MFKRIIMAAMLCVAVGITWNVNLDIVWASDIQQAASSEQQQEQQQQPEQQRVVVKSLPPHDFHIRGDECVYAILFAPQPVYARVTAVENAPPNADLVIFVNEEKVAEIRSGMLEGIPFQILGDTCIKIQIRSSTNLRLATKVIIEIM